MCLGEFWIWIFRKFWQGLKGTEIDTLSSIEDRTNGLPSRNDLDPVYPEHVF